MASRGFLCPLISGWFQPMRGTSKRLDSKEREIRLFIPLVPSVPDWFSLTCQVAPMHQLTALTGVWQLFLLLPLQGGQFKWLPTLRFSQSALPPFTFARVLVNEGAICQLPAHRLQCDCQSFQRLSACTPLCLVTASYFPRPTFHLPGQTFILWPKLHLLPPDWCPWYMKQLWLYVSCPEMERAGSVRIITAIVWIQLLNFSSSPVKRRIETPVRIGASIK